MRCPDCNKFVSMEMAEPEIESEDISEDGLVTVSVKISRECAECGTELKEATLEMEEDLSENPEVAAHINKEGESVHELALDTTADQLEEGGGRYAKSYFGAVVACTVTCNCDVGLSHTFDVSDKVAASDMEELT